MLRALIVLLLFTVPATAQIRDFGEFERAETRFGVLQVFPGQGVSEVRLNGQPTGLTDFRLWIVGAYAFPGEAADWVVIGGAHGGNMCPVTFRMLRVSQAGLTASPLVGECLGGPVALRVLPGRLELDLADPDLRISHRTYGWSGFDDVRETAVSAAQPQASALTAAQAVALGGQNPAGVLRDPAVQALFLQHMAPDEVEEMRRRVSVSGGVVVRNGWVFGEGCMQHQCNGAWGIWGIRLADMQVAAMAITRGATAQSYGSRVARADPVWINASMTAASK